MCRALYIATHDPLPVSERLESDSVFFVRELERSGQTIVKQHFTKPEVRHLGAHTWCSCGFSYDEDLESVMPAEQQLGRRSVEELRRFLEQQVVGERDIELFHCWEGDEGDTPKHRLEVTPSHFGGPSFRLEDRALYRVRSAAKQADAADEAQGGTRNAGGASEVVGQLVGFGCVGVLLVGAVTVIGWLVNALLRLL